jgi:hypothetical protein
MGVTAVVVAVLCVLFTFGWIVVDSVRSRRRELRIQVQHETGVVFNEQRMKSCDVSGVEGRVLGQMMEIQDISLRKSKTKVMQKPDSVDPEMTPRDLKAVDPLGDETRTMMAIRVKTEDIDRMAKKKARA